MLNYQRVSVNQKRNVQIFGSFFSVGKCHKESSDFGMSTLSTMAMGIAVSWKYRIDASDVGMDLGGIGIQNARLVPSLITTDHSW
jgi:hypothetical protein